MSFEITRDKFRENRWDLLSMGLQSLGLDMVDCREALEEFGFSYIEPKEIGPETHKATIDFTVIPMADHCDNALIFSNINDTLYIEAI